MRNGHSTATSPNQRSQFCESDPTSAEPSHGQRPTERRKLVPLRAAGPQWSASRARQGGSGPPRRESGSCWGRPPPSMPTRTDGSQSILYLTVSSATPGSGPNAKMTLPVELLENGSDLSDAPGQVSDHARTNADQNRHRPELLHADAIRYLHTSLYECVF